MSTVETAFEKYTALLELERRTGTRTTRTRDKLVRELSENDLIEFALKMKGSNLNDILPGR